MRLLKLDSNLAGLNYVLRNMLLKMRLSLPGFKYQWSYTCNSSPVPCISIHAFTMSTPMIMTINDDAVYWGAAPTIRPQRCLRTATVRPLARRAAAPAGPVLIDSTHIYYLVAFFGVFSALLCLSQSLMDTARRFSRTNGN